MTQPEEHDNTPATPAAGGKSARLHLDEFLARHSVSETVDRTAVIDLIKALRSPDVKTDDDRQRVVEKSRLWREVSHVDTAMSLLNSLAQMAPILLNQIHW